MWPLLVLAFLSVIIIADRLAVFCILFFSKSEKSGKSGSCSSKLKKDKFLNVLELIAQVAPVLGFLGTVTGIMASFKGLSTSDTVNLQAVSAGMYEALFTTAAGLVISIVDSVLAQMFRWGCKDDYLEKDDCLKDGANG